jgi:hypothetical protein
MNQKRSCIKDAAGEAFAVMIDLRYSALSKRAAEVLGPTVTAMPAPRKAATPLPLTLGFGSLKRSGDHDRAATQTVPRLDRLRPPTFPGSAADLVRACTLQDGCRLLLQRLCLKSGFATKGTNDFLSFLCLFVATFLSMIGL